MRRSTRSALWLLPMILILTLSPLLNSPLSAQDAPSGQLAITGITSPTHDPTLFKFGDTYFIARTNSNQLRSAPSLNGPWTTVSGTIPGGSNKWAPHVREVNGTYYLYYAVSSFGTNNSRIGVMSSTTPNVPGSWVDRNPTLITSGTLDPNNAGYNAIDPAIHPDDDGNWWIVWGSHFDGIMIRQLNDDMISVVPDGPITLLAHRGSEQFPVQPAPTGSYNRVEGPVIFKRGDYYYLVVAWDWCCRADGNDNTYKVVIGRSQSITGPYVDKNGVDLAQGGGSMILNSRVALPGIITGNQLYRAPGGVDILIEDGVYYMIYHAYRGSTQTVAIRPMDWHDDWPFFYENDGGPYDLRDGYFYRLIGQAGIITDPNGLQNPVAGNTCLTVADEGGELNVIHAECSDSPNQVWQLEKKFDGFYRLRSLVVNGQRTCLTMANDSGEVGTNVVVSPCLETGDTLQQWYFDDTGHGFHRPVVKQANLALEIENDEGVRGTNVVGGYRRDGTNSAGNLTQAGKWPPQQWRFAMIDDTTAPSLSVSASPSTLWPANHKLVTVNISIDVSDNLDPQPEVTLLSVVSSEPDSGAGDTTQGDIVIVDNQTLQLRAERTGKDNGRIYTITYEATDAYGNSTTASTTVTVPHNQGPGNSGNSTEALSDDELPFRAFIPVIQQ